jgi:hypothetical protein
MVSLNQRRTLKNSLLKLKTHSYSVKQKLNSARFLMNFILKSNSKMLLKYLKNW